MSKKMNYVSKLVVNGQEVAQHAKQVQVKIKDNEVTLNCTYIHESELANAYTSSFNVTSKDKTIKVIYVKVENRVSASIYINETLAFSSLSMQGVFAVVNSAYGISKSTLNGLYVKSNATRKQSSKSVSSIVVESNFEF